MDNNQALTPRETRRLRAQQRHTVIFTSITAVMLLAGLLSSLVASGIIPLPFGKAFNERTVYAIPGQIICPPEDSAGITLATAKVRVFNTTDRKGLADEVAKAIQSSGAKIEQVGNSQTAPFDPDVKITAGPRAIAQAYLVSQFFDSSKVELAARDNDVVDISIGSNYKKMVNAQEVKDTLESAQLESPDKCLPLDPKDLEDANRRSSDTKEPAKEQKTKES